MTKPRKQLLKALAEVGVTEDDWRSIERARRQVDIVNAQLVGRDAGVMYAVTCVPRQPTPAKPTVQISPIDDRLSVMLGNVGDLMVADMQRLVTEPQRNPGTYFRFLAGAYWEKFEAERRAELRGREMWLQGVKRRLGIIETGDDPQIRIAQWLADHPGNPGLVPQPLLDAIACLP